jgi:hypothetical protein
MADWDNLNQMVARTVYILLYFLLVWFINECNLYLIFIHMVEIYCIL